MPAPEIFSLKGRRVFVAGHRGMAGGAIVRRLAQEECGILTAGREELDLLRQQAVEDWMAAKKPDVVVIAAARVGGILANSTLPAEFIYQNLVIETNLIHAAWKNGVAKLLFLGSSCIYPREAPQPMSEDQLLTGPLEPTNEWYAVAKIAGIKLCQAYRRQYGADFISAMPTNLYGPGDNFDPLSSHAVAALIAKVHKAKSENAKEIVLWGTGKPLREFLYADDCADGLVFLLKRYSAEPHVNVGTGREHSILQMAEAIARAANWQGQIVHDLSKPDGMPRKMMDVAKLARLGWSAPTSFETGIQLAYDWYVANKAPR
jgi:GDP-L-fucose synthase